MDKELARITGETRGKSGHEKSILSRQNMGKDQRGGENILYQISNK